MCVIKNPCYLLADIAEHFYIPMVHMQDIWNIEQHLNEYKVPQKCV